MNPAELPAECRDADDVSRLLERCFGTDPAGARGTIHTAAVWESPSGPRVIRVGEHAPKSTLDFFLLHVARARASAILTTGSVLRDEPTLHYDLGIGAGFATALELYRAQKVGLEKRPRLIVLTRGDDLELTHPALHGWARPVLFVPKAAPSSLEEVGTMHAVEIRRFDALDLDVALAELRREGETTIAIEAGIKTTSALYDRGEGFDELVLGRYLEASIDARAIGDGFPAGEILERWYGAPTGSAHAEETSGRWSFSRYRRSGS